MVSLLRISTTRAAVSREACPAPIQLAILALEARPALSGIRLVDWHGYGIGVATSVSVNLPARGPVGTIDIRSDEPVVIVFHKVRFPHQAPVVYVDRPDFPAESLPHMYPAQNGQPPALCLHWGHVDDWFAAHSIDEFVDRVRSWFEDAAGNRLIRSQDLYEPTRVGGAHDASISIYDPHDLQEAIRQNWQARSGAGWGVLVCNRPISSSHSWSLARRDVYPPSILDSIRRAPKSTNQKVLGVFDAAVHMMGVLIYGARSHIVVPYIASLPGNLGELRQFAQRHKLPLNKALEELTNLVMAQEFLPVVAALQRPRPLIGTQSSIELLNFAIDGRPYMRDLKKESPGLRVVWCNLQLRPATVGLARRLSGLASPLEAELTKAGLVFGCGALGSKVSIHLARAGHVCQTLVDHDICMPHNMIRNGLPPDYVGVNKATATEQMIERIFAWDAESTYIQALPFNALEVLLGKYRQVLGEHQYILDCTASVAVLDTLVAPHVSTLPRIMRCEIGHRGHLGFVLIEGPERNPRLDDLQAILYDRALDDSRIADWLKSQTVDTESDVGPALEEISIGLGCSSNTMPMADDIVSYHAALASAMVRRVLERNWGVAGIQISAWNEQSSASGSVDFFEVGAWLPLGSVDTKGWQVRVPSTLAADLIRQLQAAEPNETGGILLGVIHPKRKVISVTRALPPPPDSQGWPYAFRLGIRDVPEQLDEINKRTGGLVRYVGEWHSHPNGSAGLSSIDRQAVDQISKSLRGRQPTHVMIVTDEACHPHVFDSPSGSDLLVAWKE